MHPGDTVQSQTNVALREFITYNFLFGDDSVELSDDTSLLKRGIVDSTGVLSLLMFSEETFGISIPDTDVTPEHFDSLGSLTAYIDARLSEGVSI